MISIMLTLKDKIKQTQETQDLTWKNHLLSFLETL